MNQPVYLSLSILDLSKTIIYEFWYDYVKPKYGNFIVHVKTWYYKDIAEDVETKFITSSYELEKSLSKGKK